MRPKGMLTSVLLAAKGERIMKPTSILISVLFALALVLPACGPTATEPPQPTAPPAPTEAAAEPTPEPTQPPAEPTAIPGPRQGGRLVLGQVGGPIHTLDPILAIDDPSGLVVSHIFSPLLRVGEDGESIEPEAAASYELSEDGLSYTFYLREDLKFSDGSPVLPEDVIFSLQRVAGEGSRWGWMMPPMEQMEPVGENAVRIVLENPSPSFAANMAHLLSSIVPKKMVEEQGEAFWDKPIGSGPFMIEEWVKGEYITLVRNPNYWDPSLPYLDEVVIEPAADDNTRMLKFQAGEYDIALRVPPNQIDQISALAHATVSIDTPAVVGCLLVNQNRGALGDKNVRLAMNYAIDRQGLIKAIAFGQGQEATSYLPPMLYWNDELEGYPYDLEKAREYMAMSTAPDGLEVSVLGNSGDQVSREIVTALIDMWGEINIDLKSDLMERGAALQRAFQGDYDLFLNVFSSDTIDPELLSRAMLYSKGFTAPLMGYKNERFDELAEQTSVDPEVRRQAYYEMQELANEDAPLVLIYYPKWATALQDYVKGFNMVPTGDYDLSRIWLEK